MNVLKIIVFLEELLNLIKSKFKKYLMLIFLISSVLALVLSFYFMSSSGFNFVHEFKDFLVSKGNLQILANLGSYLGGIVTPILTVLSLVFVYKTLAQQISDSQKSQKIATDVVKQQSFESTLNILLEQHNLIISELSVYEIPQGEINVFKKYNAGDDFIDYTFWNYKENRESYKEHILVNRYHRVLYQVLKHIDDSDLDDPYKYSRILRSFIPNNLLMLVSFNVIRAENDELLFKKYKGYIEKYSMLEHLIFDERIMESTIDLRFIKSNLLIKLVSTYDASAFGDRKNVNDAYKKLAIQVIYNFEIDDYLWRGNNKFLVYVRDSLNEFINGNVLFKPDMDNQFGVYPFVNNFKRSPCGIDEIMSMFFSTRNISFTRRIEKEIESSFNVIGTKKTIYLIKLFFDNWMKINNYKIEKIYQYIPPTNFVDIKSILDFFRKEIEIYHEMYKCNNLNLELIQEIEDLISNNDKLLDIYIEIFPGSNTVKLP